MKKRRSQLHWILMVAVAVGAGAMSPHGIAAESEPDSGDGGGWTVETLLAMEPDQRRTLLDSMDPSERRGLWMKLKQARANKANAVSTPDGRYRELGNKLDEPVVAPGSNRATGTIQFDDGVGTTSFGGGAIIGNRFDTHTGIPVFASGTVSTVQAVMVQGPTYTPTTNNVLVVVLGPQTTGGGALAIASDVATATATTSTVTFTGLGASYTGSSFFVLMGDFASQFVPLYGNGTTLGQGHHGVVGYTGGSGPNITSTFDFGGTLNGLVRATGNIVPVELMSFDIE